ncbi:MAG: hypothetical protein SWY16_00495 [Cyanobacteriota bacterium]|nr:hypothetical protein [Cyanobacteriota bacterium]
MTQGNILEQAKQGNPDAIAALMSRSMKSQGIDVRASLEGSCLQVRLEAPKVPSPQATIAFVRKGMTNLGIETIDSVDIQSYQAGAALPTWQERIFLRESEVAEEPEELPPPLPDLDEEETRWGNEEVAIDSESALETNGVDELVDEEMPDMQDLDSSFDSIEIGPEGTIPQESINDEDYTSELPDELSGFASMAEFPENEYGAGVNEDSNNLETEDSPMEEEQKPKTSPLALLLVLLVALGLGGFYIYTQKPELLASVPILKDYLPGTTPSPDDATATAPAAPPEAPAAAPAEAPPANPDAAAPPAEAPPAEAPAAPVPTNDGPDAAAPPAEAPAEAPAATETAEPFRDAVNKANSATSKIETAQTPADWSQIAADWQDAVTLMEAVPETHPEYATAQDRIPKYRRFLEYAQQQAAQ